jgi:hypothetical protein
VNWKKLSFGVRQSLGAIDVRLAEEMLGSRYSPNDLIVASSRGEVEARINAIEEARERANLLVRLEASSDSEGNQAVEAYHGFHIVYYGGKVYGLRQTLGPIDLTDVGGCLKREYSAEECIVGASGANVRARIDLLEMAQQIDALVRRVTELSAEVANLTSRGQEVAHLARSHRGFNLVHFNGKVYGLRQSLGPINLVDVGEQIEKRYGAEDCIAGDSDALVLTRIDILELGREIAALKVQLEVAQQNWASRLFRGIPR